jgi:regulator of protease activity HflC (stomatin/prohibitin superfamily)
VKPSQTGLIGLMSGLCLAASGCATVMVGPGEIGVLWTANNGTQAQTYGEGAHNLSSGDVMSIYDLRTNSKDEALEVIASNGLGIKLDASVLFHVVPKEIVQLQEEIGPEYYAKILAPVLRSEARRVIGQYTPEEIYSTKRELIEREIFDGLVKTITGRHIVLETVLIRDVTLPDAIEHAIDNKLQAEQEVLRMKYVLEVAKSKAEEQRVEAQGIADYNRTVASSLTPAILEFQRTQQLGQLATSANAKTVVMGPGTNPSVTLSAQSGSPAPADKH